MFHLKKSHQKKTLGCNTEAALPAAYTRKKNTKKATGKSASSEPYHCDFPNSTTKNRKTAPAERNSQATGSRHANRTNTSPGKPSKPQQFPPKRPHQSNLTKHSLVINILCFKKKKQTYMHNYDDSFMTLET